jgi:hypothetical protein
MLLAAAGRVNYQVAASAVGTNAEVAASDVVRCVSNLATSGSSYRMPEVTFSTRGTEGSNPSCSESQRIAIG